MQLSRKKSSQIALLSVSLATSAGVSIFLGSTSSVLAFGFQDTNTGKIQMFDSSGNQVGSGEFTYVPFDGRIVRSLAPGLVPPVKVVYESPNAPLSGPSVLSAYKPADEFAMLTSFNVNLTLNGTPFTLSRTSPALTQTGQSIGDLFFFSPPNSSVLPPNSTGTFLTVKPVTTQQDATIDSRSGVWSSCVPACGVLQRQMYSFREDGTWSLMGAPIGSNSNPAIASAVGVGFTEFRGRFELSTQSSTPAPEPTTILGTLFAVGAGWAAKKRWGHQVTPVRRQNQTTQRDVA